MYNIFIASVIGWLIGWLIAKLLPAFIDFTLSILDIFLTRKIHELEELEFQQHIDNKDIYDLKSMSWKNREPFSSNKYLMKKLFNK